MAIMELNKIVAIKKTFILFTRFFPQNLFQIRRYLTLNQWDLTFKLKLINLIAIVILLYVNLENWIVFNSFDGREKIVCVFVYA